jgi:ABC-type dipeptide/oligopeptide/nickel transport system permease subunit
MIKRLLQSRGAGKFKRNRLAMCALGVIGVYFVSAFWMMFMDALLFVGNTTGAYDLYKAPVMSTFLPKRVLAEIGPPMLGGFGQPWGDDGRAKSIDFYYTKAQSAVDTIESVSGITDESVRNILAEASVEERLIADVSFDEIKAMVDEITSILAEMDTVSSTANTAIVIDVSVNEVQAALTEFASPTSDTDPDFLRENVGFAIDELVFAISDFQTVAPESEAFTIDLVDSLTDAALVYIDGEGTADDLPALLDQAKAAASAAASTISGGAESYVADAEVVIDNLFPSPSGLAGVSFKTRQLLGTDRQGRSILLRTIYSAKIAIQVGFVVGLSAVLFGSILGAAAAFFGGWVDHIVAWLYSTFSSIPQLVLLAVLSFMFLSDALSGFRGLPSLYFAFAMTYWIGPCRVIRGESMKIKELEYVQAATAIGFGRFYILLKHIIPNTMHLMFINFSLLFIGAIKGEVILTFLGLGLPLGSGASWGIMISQAKSEVVSGFFWQIGAATFFMFVLVLAFNIVSDALQDAFDPKHVN